MSYHQQTSRAQCLAKVAAQPFCPLQFCMFRRSGCSCHLSLFASPELSLPTHTTDSVPLNHVAPLGIAVAHRQGTESFPMRHRFASCQSVSSSAGCVGNADPARKGLLGRRSPGSQARISAVRFGTLTGVENGAWCGSPYCPHTCDVVQHFQLPAPLWPWLHKCCMCGLCLSTILSASSSI